MLLFSIAFLQPGLARRKYLQTSGHLLIFLSTAGMIVLFSYIKNIRLKNDLNSTVTA